MRFALTLLSLFAQAVQSLCEAGVPVPYFSMGGYFYGITIGLNTVSQTVFECVVNGEPAPMAQAFSKLFHRKMVLPLEQAESPEKVRLLTFLRRPRAAMGVCRTLR